MSKIKIVFIKFGGLSAGGTERWLQMMAANLPKDTFEIDYYYCDTAPYVGSDYKHAGINKDRLTYMEFNNVNLIKFHVGKKDISTKTHDWIDTDFWKKFDETKYDIVQAAKAGPAEYPYHKINLPIVEFIALDSCVDFSPNIARSIHISKWQQLRWKSKGGNLKKSTLIPVPAQLPVTNENFRKEYNIPEKALVAGFHQRADNNIFSPIPLEAFSRIKNPQFYFALLCGSSKYKALAEKLRIKNIRFIKPKSDELTISKFLNTLDIFAHGRKDGETFGTVFAEAMMHKKPCLSHWSPIANAHKETMGPAGLFAKDLDDYTEKLHSLFTNHELRKKLALSAKPFAEKHYSLQAAVKNLAKIYHDVYKKHKSYKKSKFKYAIHAYNNIDILVRKYGVARKIKKVITNPKLIIKKACYLFTKDDI
jgi:hypothetical protein